MIGDVVIIIGPSGSGKTVVGTALSRLLNLPFLDADDLHPQGNRWLLRRGVQLTDEDRAPWLQTVARRARASAPCVLACSALRRTYRDQLARDIGDATFVELGVASEHLTQRVDSRDHPFMSASLLPSQIAAFEPLAPDEHGISVRADRADIQTVATNIAAALSR